MAYRLEKKESVPRGVKRIAREELESAAEQLREHQAGDRDEAIHEARKSVKKVRGVLRLVRPMLNGVYDRENPRLRDAGHMLSGLRDAAALIETLDSLRAKHPSPALRAVRATLVKRKNEAMRAPGLGNVLEDVASTLDRVDKRVKQWPLHCDGFKAIRPGLDAAFRKSKRAFTHARTEPTPANFHEWRKRVKDHWYQIRLLESTEAVETLEKQLKSLETSLGEDHNLAVLRELILAEPDSFGTQQSITVVLGLIDQYQKELRDESLAIGDKLYRGKAAAFTKELSGYWKAWRS